MNAGWIRLLCVSIALCLSQAGQAATTCSAISSPGFSTALGAQNPPGLSTLPNITSFIFTITCSRAVAGDPATVQVWANNGANAGAGGQNRARFPGGTRLNYEVYPDSTCSGTPWTSGGTANCNAGNGCISVPVNIGANINYPVTVYGCVPTGQTSASSGSYADTVQIRVRNAANTAWLTAAATFPVAIQNPASCSVTSISTLNLSYTSFDTSDSTGTATITLNCTNLLPYQMSFNTYAGTLLGLNYTIDIDGTTALINTRGTGPGKTYTVNGRIASGQSGTCALASCTAGQTHTLTITW